jgi:hypothetical protein
MAHKNPQTAENISNSFSLILRLCFIDFRLSIHRTANVTIFTIIKYIIIIMFSIILYLYKSIIHFNLSFFRFFDTKQWRFFKLFYYWFRYLSKIQLTNLGDPASEYLLHNSIISLINISLGVWNNWYSVYHNRNIAWSTMSISS